MDETDMSGVAPLRLEETKRRIAVVKAYLAVRDPSPEDRAAHAGQLELSVNQFLALVRSWREYRDPSRLDCSGSGRHRPRATGPRHLDAGLKEQARLIVRSLPADTTLAVAHAHVVERLAADGKQPPSRATIYRMMRERKRPADEDAGPGYIVVGRVLIRLPVELYGRLVLPEITIAVATRNGSIVAAEATNDGADASVVDQASRASAETGSRLVIDERLVDLRAADRSDRVAPGRARTLLNQAIGKRIGGDDGPGAVEVIYQSRWSFRAETLLKHRKDRPLDAAAFAAVLARAVHAQNAAIDRPPGHAH